MKVWFYLKAIAAAVGFVLILGAAGNSDYAIATGTAEPAGTWALAIIGFAMMLPLAWGIVRESMDNDEN